MWFSFHLQLATAWQCLVLTCSWGVGRRQRRSPKRTLGWAHRGYRTPPGCVISPCFSMSPACSAMFSEPEVTEMSSDLGAIFVTIFLCPQVAQIAFAKRTFAQPHLEAGKGSRCLFEMTWQLRSDAQRRQLCWGLRELTGKGELPRDVTWASAPPRVFPEVVGV